MDYSSIIDKIVSKAFPLLEKLPDTQASLKPSPNTWSKKEILGHLLDSANVNHQRIIRAEKQGHLEFLGYDPCHWVSMNNYQHMDWGQLVVQWKKTQQYLGDLIKNVDERSLRKTFVKHNLHQVCMNPFPARVPGSLSYLVWDYLQHLEHHLAELLPTYEKVDTAYDPPIPSSKKQNPPGKISWLAFR